MKFILCCYADFFNEEKKQGFFPVHCVCVCTCVRACVCAMKAVMLNSLYEALVIALLTGWHSNCHRKKSTVSHSILLAHLSLSVLISHFISYSHFCHSDPLAETRLGPPVSICWLSSCCYCWREPHVCTST